MKRFTTFIFPAVFSAFIGVVLTAGLPVFAQVPSVPDKLPPGKLTQKQLPAANPLRQSDEPATGFATSMEQRKQQAVANDEPLEQLVEPQMLNEPVRNSQPIAQTAMESEPKQPPKMQKPAPPFADFPSPPAANGSILDSTGGDVWGAESEANQVQRSQEPQPNTLRSAPLSAVQVEPLQHAAGNNTTLKPKAESPLASADPFAEVSEPAKIPPIQQTPIAAKTASPVKQPSASKDNRLQTNGLNKVNEGSGLPGQSVLEGPQTAFLTVEKVLPAEVKLEEPAVIQTVIHNTGRSAAKNIVLKDKIPKGTKLLSTSPETTAAADGELLWQLGNLDANEKITVEMKFLPQCEGEIGSVASVSYAVEASARLEVTRPMLKVEVKAPAEVRHGEIADIEITISNPGTATATGVILEEYVPDGLYHKDGKILVNKNVDTLRPKEAKRLTLPLTCTGHGNLVNRLIVKANGNLTVEEKTTIRALSPILELGIAGPNQQFLERQSAYRLTVANKGTSAAQSIDLVATLPSAVKFVSTNQSGVYEPQTHTVHWALEELPAQEAGEIELNLLPVQTGEHVIRFKGLGQNNLKEETLKQVVIDGLSALSFEVVSNSNLVELGKEAVYEVRVQNKGTKKTENVKVRLNLSEGLQFARADGPVRHQENGGVVVFETLPQLEAKGEKVYKVGAKGLTDGDHRISVQVSSDDLRSPLTKEEPTRVFK
ncbi:MAG: DUF11 domain-containing protein [Planctomycetaceae bacterium]|nr:DUF11 domain-containing protein [Planctomycetaceae bacterium]